MRIQTQRICLVMLAMLSLCCGLARAADSGEQMVTSDDKRVRFWAVNTPEKTVETLPERKGAPYKRTSYTMEADGGTLMLGVLEFRPSASSSPSQEMAYLDTMFDNLRTGFNFQFLLDTEARWKDIELPTVSLPGKEIKGRLEGQDFTLRAFIAPNTIYMQQTSHKPKNKKAAAIADKFLNSLLIEKE